MKELEGVITISNELTERVYSNSFNEENKFKIEDKVILGLLTSIIEKSTSVKILYENKHYAGADILLRSIFEASLILQFILKQHTRDRSIAYYLSIQLKEIEIAETIVSESDVGKIIKRYLKEYGHIPEFDILNEVEKIALIKEDFKKITSAEKSDSWLNIQTKRTTNKGKKAKLKSFRSLCEYLGDQTLAEYEVIYRMLSQEVHAKEIKEYYTENDGYLQLTKRNESGLIMSLCKAMIIESSKSVAKRYNQSQFYNKRMRSLSIQRKLNKR